MTRRRLMLKTAVAAAGLGAVLAFPGVAAASPGEESGHRPATGARADTSAPSRSPASRHPGRSQTRSQTPSGGASTVKAGRAARVGVPRTSTAPGSFLGPSLGAPVAAVRPPGPIRAAVLAMQAYVYGYPLLDFEKFRAGATSLNAITLRTSFADPDGVPIWRPNADTFYSRAVLDLSSGPVVLSIPDMGDRYFSFQLIDPYTNVISYIGARATGSGPGTFVITWDGGPPIPIADQTPDAQTVTVPYRNILVLGRTLAGDPADQVQAVALMNQFRLTPSGPAAAPPAVTADVTGLALLDAVSAAMELHPPSVVDAVRLAALSQIGVGPGMRVAEANLGPVATLAADLAVRAAVALLPVLSGLVQYDSALMNRGWALTDPDIGHYGTDYQLRAGVAFVGPWANIPDEAVYSAGLLDRYLLPLNGSHSYVMHFAPGQEPPAGAFWSVTVYDPSGGFVRNPLNRYSVSSSRPGELVHRPDGSVDIIFSEQDPADPDANWLPVPAGGFSAYLRVYVPGQAVLDGSWTPPPIERL